MDLHLYFPAVQSSPSASARRRVAARRLWWPGVSFILPHFTIATCLMWNPGCAPAMIAGAGVTAGFALAQGQAEAFLHGELQAARLVTLEHAINASLTAMDELQLQVRTKRVSDRNAFVMAKAKGGREFQLSFRSDSPIVTKISVRVGVMGDQAVSRLVLSIIDSHLGVPAPLVPVEISPFVAPAPRPREIDK